MAIVHVAGPVVGIGTRIIQRCAVCGDKLADNIRVAMPLNPDGSLPSFPTWKEGDLIEFDGHRQNVVGNFGEDGPLPDDFCIILVEA